MDFKILFTTFFGIILFSNLVLAQIMPPHAFYGTVTWNGSPASDGKSVVAKINGVEVASTTTKDGKYGYEPIFYIAGDRSGDEINFFVNGVDTGKTVYFVNGKITLLDLTATGPEEPSPQPPAGGGGGGGGGGLVTPTTTEEPEEVEEEPQPCQERWLCDDWSECEDGQQTRVCEDVNECGTDRDIPLMIQPCSKEEIEETAKGEEAVLGGPTGFFLGLSTTEWAMGGIIGVIIAAIIIFLVTRRKKSKIV
ncbi:MAG: hypothetical protein GTN36_04600 [Candidatus Aenigmarchaeota archaeon]|nr:hypothetical protein [Candidatus Aenigmarchaeota archaeon]